MDMDTSDAPQGTIMFIMIYWCLSKYGCVCKIKKNFDSGKRGKEDYNEE